MMLDTATAFDALVRRNAGDDEQAERILANPFYRNMSGALSGTQEYMAAETLHQLHGDERFDLVVVDTPPSRNALDFLEASGVLARFLDHRLFRLLMLPARGGMQVVNRGDAAADAGHRQGRRVRRARRRRGVLPGVRRHGGRVPPAGRRRSSQLLRSDATRYVIVASPHRDTVTEAVWFAAQLADQGIDPLAGVANRVHPPFGPGTAADAPCAATPPATAGDVAALWRNVAELRALAEAAARRAGPVRRPARRRPAGRGAAARRRRPRPRRARRDPAAPLRRGRDGRYVPGREGAAGHGRPMARRRRRRRARRARTRRSRSAPRAARWPRSSRTARRAGEPFDVGIFDLQIGSMGGMAVTMAMRLDASSGRLPHVPVLMLLDRVADVFLARRSGADGWIVKPLDPLRLRRAVRAVVAGGTLPRGPPGARPGHRGRERARTSSPVTVARRRRPDRVSRSDPAAPVATVGG